MGEYSKYNAREVLSKLNDLIDNIDNMYEHKYRVADICFDLNIFDWWLDDIYKNKLLEMERFLKESIKLGYDGYVCFKVGAEGCSNGMWAHKEESINGYSPSGDALYKSFTPSYNYWSIKSRGQWYPTRDEGADSLTTTRKFENYYTSMKERI